MPTPRAAAGPTEDIVSFQLIDSAGIPDPWRIISALPALRRMPGDGLARFDPFLRIETRLSGAPAFVRHYAEQCRADNLALDWAATGVIHGDFHPGQTILDKHGKVWLIDLDDLALAPVEADLGNLAAWMATQEATDLALGLEQCIMQVQHFSARLLGAPDMMLVAHFARIATLRRALKLNERGKGWALAQLSSLT